MTRPRFARFTPDSDQTTSIERGRRRAKRQIRHHLDAGQAPLRASTFLFAQAVGNRAVRRHAVGDNIGQDNLYEI